MGSLAVAFVVPKAQINLTQSLLTAYNDIFAWAGISWAGSVVAVMLAIGVFAGVVTWIAGPSSGLLAVGKAGYLPRFFQKTNKHGMATSIMMTQAAVVTVLTVLPSVQSVYQILGQLTVILYLVMYLLMFGIRPCRRPRPPCPTARQDRPRPVTGQVRTQGQQDGQRTNRPGRPAYRFPPVARSVKRRAVPTAEHGYFRVILTIVAPDLGDPVKSREE